MDPRDVEREVDDPTYRVVFWEQISGEGFGADEYDVTGVADVEEVLAWARTRASAGQTFTIHALVDRTALRLLGDDPTRTDLG